MTDLSCVNCPAPAANGWLVCLECAARIDDAMVDGLIEKRTSIRTWLLEAEQVLEQLPAGDPRYPRGWEVYSQRAEVYDRLSHLFSACGPETHQDGQQAPQSVETAVEPPEPLQHTLL